LEGFTDFILITTSTIAISTLKMEIKERKENNMAVPSSFIPTVKKKKLLKKSQEPRKRLRRPKCFLTFVFPELEKGMKHSILIFFVERSS